MARKSSGSQRHHIDSQLMSGQAGSSMQHCPARREQPLVLFRGQGGQGGLHRGAAFDLDDGQHPAPAGEDVDLPAAPLQPEAEDLIALEHQPGRRHPFRGVALPERLAAQRLPPRRLGAGTATFGAFRRGSGLVSSLALKLQRPAVEGLARQVERLGHLGRRLAGGQAGQGLDQGGVGVGLRGDLDRAGSDDDDDLALGPSQRGSTASSASVPRIASS
jgi:hypothetical protein